MSTTNNGGPAFPVASPDTGTNYGMSLRDYFAGQALAGIWANHETTGTSDDLAALAYKSADAMLAAREQRTPTVEPAPVAKVEPKTWAAGTFPPVAEKQARRDANGLGTYSITERAVTRDWWNVLWSDGRTAQYRVETIALDPLAEPWTEPAEVTP